MEGKKISFGFLKTKKVEKPVIEEKKDYIECMEEKSLKIIGGEKIKEAAPLVIPMKPNTLVTAERLKQIAEEVESAVNAPELDEKKPSTPPPTNLEKETLDQMVVRELMLEAKKEVKTEASVLSVPIPANPVISGQKESSLQDYEEVPIQDFGLAMLRGMGWTPGKESSKYKPPQLRPKGLGLGADKIVSDNQKKKQSVNDKGEELAIVKNSFVKITSGKYSGYYGKVLSLDEDNGRVMVDISVKKETVSLSEFMMQPVTKAEFDKESKVINTGSFEEYKKKEVQKPSNNEPKPERAASSSKGNDSNNRDHVNNYKYKPRRDYDSPEEKRDRYMRDSSGSEDRSRSRRKEKKKKRYSSNDSLDSISDSDKRRKHKSSKKCYNSDSDSDTESPKDKRKKRDIDKKRKGKKKKRDRDRSPHYKKYKK